MCTVACTAGTLATTVGRGFPPLLFTLPKVDAAEGRTEIRNLNADLQGNQIIAQYLTGS